MVVLPQFNTDIQELTQMQNTWASALNPIISLPLNSSVQLNNINVVAGDNSINHLLGRKLIGWSVIRMQNGFVQLYDKQNTNLMSNKTLILNSSGTGLISLLVF